MKAVFLPTPFSGGSMSRAQDAKGERSVSRLRSTRSGLSMAGLKMPEWILMGVGAR